MKELVPIGRIEQIILSIRGQKVILDADLAKLYGVSTRALNQAVKRNKKRFPFDFMFQLNDEERRALRSQIVILKGGRGQHRKFLPYAFTEHGAMMAASVLNTARAIDVSVFVVRAFVKLKEMVSAHREIAQKLAELERKFEGHDVQIQSLFEAIRQLMGPAAPKRSRIGFRTG